MLNVMMRQVGLTIVAIACVALGACSGGEVERSAAAAQSESDAAPPAPPPDPRFATAQALLEHAKSIVDAPQPNMHAFYDLFQSETRDQETWLQFVRDVSLPYSALRTEFKKRFPSEPWPTTIPLWFSEVRIPHARLTSSDEQRAQSEFSEGRTTHVLHLMKKYDRWWISGYSLERARSVDALREVAADTQQTLDLLLLAASRERQGVIDLTQRLKAGEFRSAAQFGAAADELFSE